MVYSILLMPNIRLNAEIPLSPSCPFPKDISGSCSCNYKRANMVNNEQIIRHRLSDKDSYNITLKMDNHAKTSPYKLQPASFSFQNSHNYSCHPPQRSFSKCLRLKTNQSFDGNTSNELKRETRKSIVKGFQSQVINEHCQRLAQEEYDLRTQSLIKQYELRLSKQEEYYGLREWKMKEEIQNLEKQNLGLAEDLRRARLNIKPAQQKCTLCGDGEVLAQYNSIITQNEEHHKNCLIEKKELLRRAEEAQSKLSALDEEHDKMCQEMRNTSRQLRSFKMKMAQMESERDSAFESLSHLDQTWKQKATRLEIQSKQLQRQLLQKENEVSQLNVSKATVESTQSVLTNPQFSLKSSLLKPRHPREDKENLVRPRASLCKAINIEEEEDRGRACLKKLSQNMPRNVRTVSVKNDAMRWKCF